MCTWLCAGAAASVLPCNHSQELGPGTWVQLLAPARDTWPPGPLECRYTLVQGGDQVQVLRLTVARFRVGSLTPTGCVGGSLQVDTQMALVVTLYLPLPDPGLCVRGCEPGAGAPLRRGGAAQADRQGDGEDGARVQVSRPSAANTEQPDAD